MIPSCITAAFLYVKDNGRCRCPKSVMHRVYAYLIKQRHISREAVTAFAKAGTLYCGIVNLLRSLVQKGICTKKEAGNIADRIAKRFGSSVIFPL